VCHLSATLLLKSQFGSVTHSLSVSLKAHRLKFDRVRLTLDVQFSKGNRCICCSRCFRGQQLLTLSAFDAKVNNQFQEVTFTLTADTS
jgi:hypothetical protein